MRRWTAKLKFQGHRGRHRRCVRLGHIRKAHSALLAGTAYAWETCGRCKRVVSGSTPPFSAYIMDIYAPPYLAAVARQNTPFYALVSSERMFTRS